MPSVVATTQLVELFGGAITARYPINLTDASDLRQIPDTQEVWLDNESDLSLILEVLEWVKEEGAADSLEAGIKFHFDSLCHDNSALESSISEIIVPPSPSPPLLGPTTLEGSQLVSKFNLPAEKADTVTILMGLWRIPSKNVDLVLTVNFPFRKEGGAQDFEGRQRTREIFYQAVQNLEIKDWGLFAG